MNVIEETTKVVTKVAHKINYTQLKIEIGAAVIAGTVREYNNHRDYYNAEIKKQWQTKWTKKL